MMEDVGEETAECAEGFSETGSQGKIQDLSDENDEEYSLS